MLEPSSPLSLKEFTTVPLFRIHQYHREVESWSVRHKLVRDVRRDNIGFTERTPRKIIPMSGFGRLSAELKRMIFLIAVAEHANPYRYLRIAQCVREW